MPQSGIIIKSVSIIHEDNTLKIFSTDQASKVGRAFNLNESLQKKLKDRRLLRFCAATGVLIAFTILRGCFENDGRLKHNDKVTRAFQTYQVVPDYKYYYYGRTNMPCAIVGVDHF
jgi:hypothetical protein